MKRMFFALAAVAATLLAVSPALADAPDKSKRPGQQVSLDGAYVFDGHASLRAGLKQVYNRKDGTSVYFGEDFGFFHSTCGSNAFCNNIGGHDTILALGVQVAEPNIFVALSQGSFAGNGGSLTGIGLGVEKVARNEVPFEVIGSFFYYPSATGTYGCPVTATPCYATPTSTNIEYHVVHYSLGAHYAIGDKPYYLSFGIVGDNGAAISANTPQTLNHNGAYVGFGLHM